MKVSEAIEKLTNKRNNALSFMSDIYKKGDAGYLANEIRVTTYNIAINTLQQIDEPQTEKVEVPDFVAEWYEANKEDLEGNIFSITVDIYDEGAETDFEKWFYHCDTKPFETLIRMKDGYTVKPKRWVVKFGSNLAYYFNGWYTDASIRPNGHSNKGDSSVIVFTDKSKAEAVATLVEGSVEEID